MQLSSLLGHTREVLSIILKSDKPADSLIDSFFRSRKYLGSHDRRFIAESCYGTLRHLRKSDALLKEAIGSDGKEFAPEDLLLLTVVTYLNRIDRSLDPDPALLSSLMHTEAAGKAVHELLTRLPGAAVRSDDPVERVAIEYSFPDWLVRRFMDQYGPDEARVVCESLNAPAPLNLRVNTLKGQLEDCRERLAREGIETTQTALSPVGLTVQKRTNIFRLSVFREGFFEVQDEGSQLLGLLMDPKPTWKVLDACAGAGGKALHLAAIMKNRGEIMAADINAFRLSALRKRARRAGAFNIRVMTTEEIMQTDRLRGFFDMVFIDAPCSGIGTLRRNPGMKWTIREDHIQELTAKQLGIMESHSQFVKEGGLLYYATCSLLNEENQGVVREFLSRHQEFEPYDLQAAATKAGLDKFVQDGSFMVTPHTNGTDGFYCAAVRRKGRKETPDA